MALEDYFQPFSRRDWERKSVDGTVRMAVVGLGGFALNRALPAIAAGEYCETTTLVSGSVQKAARTADHYRADHVVDYDEFRRGEVSDAYDAVYVATPNALHGEYVSAAADQGKHVICEKPLETTAERARELVEVCADAGVTLMTAYRIQLGPTARRTREIVADGYIGDVVQVYGGFSHPVLEATSPDTWRLDPDLAGGGALVDLGIYPLNTTRYFLESDPVAVNAWTCSMDQAFAEVDEHVTFTLRFPGEITASCTASFDAHASSHLRLVGTDGMISISAPFGGVVPQSMVVERGEFSVEYTGNPDDEVEEEFDYFGYCVLTGTEPEPSGRDGLEDVRVIDAAYESAETEQWVEL
ncbi:Gfo/Idh/MocA family oxidoreductase [Halobacteria archaeon HArc-gm2]|nr:Gfo/Idh/MocA family oxidoreductase [Halobacteria archaeon HArc-gm2]